MKRVIYVQNGLIVRLDNPERVLLKHRDKQTDDRVWVVTPTALQELRQQNLDVEFVEVKPPAGED
jgi:hypothetical protein